MSIFSMNFRELSPKLSEFSDLGNKSGPRQTPGATLRSLLLDDANLVSLWSLWALGDVEFDSLIFI